jgi:Rod binding domain-containing protein
MTLPLAAATIGLGIAGKLVDQLSGDPKKIGTQSSTQGLSGRAATAGGLPADLAAKLAKLDPDQRRKVEANARDFEAVFLETMLDRLTSGGGEEGPLGSNGTGGEVWRGMLTNQYARSLAANGGVGIAPSVMRSLIDLQAAQGGA